MFKIISFDTGLCPLDSDYFKRIKALNTFRLPETEDIYCFQSLYGYYYGFLSLFFYYILYFIGQYEYTKHVAVFLYSLCLIVDRIFAPFYYNPRQIIIKRLSLLTTYKADCLNKNYFGFDNGLLIITNKQVINYFFVRFPRDNLIYNNGVIVMDFKHDLDKVFTLGNTQLYKNWSKHQHYNTILKRSRQLDIIRNSQQSIFHFLVGNFNINYHTDISELGNIATKTSCVISNSHNLNNLYTFDREVRKCCYFEGKISSWVDHILVNSLLLSDYYAYYHVDTYCYKSAHNMLTLTFANNDKKNKILTSSDYADL